MISVTSNDITWIFYLLISVQIILSVQTANAPIFKIYPHNDEKIAYSEPSTVQIPSLKYDGYSRLQWNAAYVSYHRAIVQNSNYQLHAFCQCSSADVSNVRFYFLWFGQDNLKEQMLKLEILSPSPSMWPTYGSTTVSSESGFNSLNGGYVILKYDRSVDMSGSIRCELETKSGLVLKSNRMDIFDVKEHAGKISGSAQAGGSNSLFPKVGLGTFEPVPDMYKERYRKVLKYIPLNVEWSLATEDVNIITAANFEVLYKLFPKQTNLPDHLIGQYYINRNGKLFVNMESNVGKKLYYEIETNGLYNKNKREVLLLRDPTSTLGDKYHVKPDEGVNLPKPNQPKLPIRIEPESDSENFFTFTGNIDHRIACGFIVNNSKSSDLRIEWYKDNELVTSEMMTRFGVMKFSGNNGVLGLADVNIGAIGAWKCVLKSDTETFPDSLSATYNLKVTRFPGFGDHNSKEKNFVGKPPALVYAVEGATINISCLVTSYDKDGNSAKPIYTVENIAISQLCSSAQPKNDALCEMRNRISVVDMDVTLDARTSVKYMNRANYIIKDILYEGKATKKKLNHIVSCSVSGSYLIDDKVNVITTQASTAVNVIPRLAKDAFRDTPRSCKDGMMNCRADVDHVFSCELSEAYAIMLKKAGVVLKKYWKIGTLTQDSIIGLVDSSAVLKKYAHFSSDGNQLTIKNMTLEEDMKTMSEQSEIRCVIEFYYPEYIRYTDLSNLQIPGTAGNGMVDPVVELAQLQGSVMLDRSPMFYSSERDNDAAFLTIPIAFKGQAPASVVTSAGSGLIVAIIMAILIILIIIMLVAYLMTRDRGETYIIDEKERAQGHNPEQELKDEQFKEYMRPEEVPIRGSRMSLASSIRVGSDDEGELDEYGDIDAGKFNEDGSFIGNYATDPRKKRQLPVV